MGCKHIGPIHVGVVGHYWCSVCGAIVQVAHGRIPHPDDWTLPSGLPHAKVYVVAEYNDDGFSEPEYASLSESSARTHVAGREKYTAVTELELEP